MADKDALDQRSGMKLRHKDLGGGVYVPMTHVEAFKGAANVANGQATAGAASAALVAARPTRRSVTVRNTDAANSCYVGAGTVSAANGFLLKAGESVAINTTAAVNGIRATADVVVCYLEEYD